MGFWIMNFLVTIGLFLVLMATRSGERRSRREFWNPSLEENWRRQRASLAAHHRLTRLKLKQLGPAIAKPLEQKPRKAA